MTEKKSGLPAPRHGHSIANLAKMLFKADAPAEFVRSLPAQSLYLAVKHLGIPACADILEMASIEQCRLLLDFDCWTKDRFNEENFWEWLSIADDEHGLVILQKLIKFIDLKLISLMIARFTEVRSFEEKTDNPPAPGFYTPDQGFTWIHITIEEGTRHFLFARLMAIIFETDAELFYQLLSVPGVATASELEEESYQERSKRIQAEGFPSDSYVIELNSPLDEAILNESLVRGERHNINDNPIVEPLIYDGILIQPLAELFASVHPREELESELTLIMNATIIRWSVDLTDIQLVRHISSKVRGAINIGLEIACKKLGTSPLGAFEKLGLSSLYRLGLGSLKKIRSQALAVPDEALRRASDESELFAIVAGAREQFPEAPNFMRSDGSFESQDGHLQAGFRAIEHQSEVDFISKYLAKSVQDLQSQSASK